MDVLKLGCRGDAVRTLQMDLQSFDPRLIADGVYGKRTEQVVRAAQKKLGLYPPDGVVGPQTSQALKLRTPGAGALNCGAPGHMASMIGRARSVATTEATFGDLASPVKSMRTSAYGLLFIIKHETLKGVSNHLHHPSAGSGVTLGAGYDMKDRSRADIVADLISVGVPPEAAQAAAKGSGLTGQPATAFAKGNKHLINLKDEQEAALLKQIVGHYEAKVYRGISVPLHQQEFDALVSFAYNPGGGWHRTCTFINKSAIHAAMDVISRQVYSHHERLEGLERRRVDEINLFLYGKY